MSSRIDSLTSMKTHVEDVRGALHHDARAAGVDIDLVDATLDNTVAELDSDASVHAYIGVLAERAVRDRLSLRPDHQG